MRWEIQELCDEMYQTAASDGVRVLLGGDRGDEVFGDNTTDFEGLVRDRHWRDAYSMFDSERSWRGVIGATRQMLGPAIDHHLPALRPWVQRRKGTVPTTPFAPLLPEAYAQYVASQPHRSRTIPRARASASARRWGSAMHPSTMRIAALNERMHARAGVVASTPFADRRVVEFVCSIPGYVVQTEPAGKQLLRSVIRPHLPDQDDSPFGDRGAPTLVREGYSAIGHRVAQDLFDEHSRLAALELIDPGMVIDVCAALATGEDVPFSPAWAMSAEAWARTAGL